MGAGGRAPGSDLHTRIRLACEPSATGAKQWSSLCSATYRARIENPRERTTPMRKRSQGHLSSRCLAFEMLDDRVLLAGAPIFSFLTQPSRVVTNLATFVIAGWTDRGNLVLLNGKR